MSVSLGVQLALSEDGQARRRRRRVAFPDTIISPRDDDPDF